MHARDLLRSAAVVAAIALGLCVAEATNPPPDSGPRAVADREPVCAGADYRVVANSIVRHAPDKNWSLEIVFPRLVDGGGTPAPIFDELAGAVEMADEFESQAREVFRDMPGGMAWSLELDYGVVHADADRVSILCDGYRYTGGAHGMPVLFAVNYNLKRHEAIRLGDLFKPGVDYLEHCARHCRAELEKKLEEMFWPQGVEPTEENFAIWTLGPAGITFIFPPYQTACYAAGPQCVTVPRAALAEIVRPGALPDASSEDK